MFGERMSKSHVSIRTVLFIVSIMLMVPLLATVVSGEGVEAANEMLDAVTDSALSSHSVIRINNDSDIVALKTSGDCTGNGTAVDPYVLQDFDIDAAGEGNAIYVGNVSVHLVIRNCSLHNASSDGSEFFDGSSITVYGSNNVSLIDNICINSDSGIHVHNSSDMVLSNNTCNGNAENGIFLNISSGNHLYENTCSDNGMDGIRLDGSDGNEIFANICENNTIYDGIYLNLSNLNTLSDNVCNGNGHTNIYLEQSNDNTLENNSCGYSVNYHGICVEASQGNTLVGNTCEGNGWYGIFLLMAENNTLTDNICGYNGFTGVLLDASMNNTISENNCSHNNDGIYLYGSGYNHVSWNVLTDNVNYSIYLKSNSTNNVVSNNTCAGSDRYGIYLNVSSDDNTIIDNICTDDRTGIQLNNTCSDNLISRNTCEDSLLYGLGLRLSDDNILVNNTVVGSASFGIHINGSSGNVIIGNLLTDNNGATAERDPDHIQAFDDSSNIWNTTYGNRWSDWLVPDSNTDGLVDQSYQIGGGTAVDHRPLSTAVTVTSPSSGTYVNDLTVSINGSAVSYFGIASITWYNGATEGSGPCDGTADWNATIPLVEGANALTVTMTDTGGRTVSASLMVYADLSLPSIVIVSPANGSFCNGSTLISWNATDDLSGISLVEYSFDGENWTEAVEGTVHDWGMTDGNWTLYLRATDGAGNVNITYIRIVVDTVAPSLSITSPSDGENVNDGNVTVSWNASDDRAGIDHYAVSTDGIDWTNVTDDHYTFTLTEGEHVIYVKAYDAAGNTNMTSVEITVDTLAPSISIISPEADALLNATSTTVQWLADDDNPFTVSIRFDDGSWITVTGNEYVWSLADGEHIVYLNVTDMAGNYNETQRQFTIDTTPATVEVSPIGNSVAVDSNIVLTFSESMDITSVVVEIEGVNLSDPSWNGNTVTFWHPIDLDNSCQYLVNVTGKDLAGNEMRFNWTFQTEMVTTFAGIITDQDGLPISGVTVTLSNGTMSENLVTGSDGTFYFDLDGNLTGLFNITAERDGYSILNIATNMSVIDGRTYDLGSFTMLPEEGRDQGMVFYYLLIVIVIVAIAAVTVLYFKRRNEKG